MVQRSVSKRHEFREGRLTGCTRSLTALLLLPLLPLPGSAPARLASNGGALQSRDGSPLTQSPQLRYIDDGRAK